MLNLLFAAFTLFTFTQSFGSHECGSREPLQSDVEFEKRVSTLWRRDILFPFDLEVHIFVINAPTSYNQPEVTDTMITDQISVIALDYKPVFRINLASINRVNNSSWVSLKKDSQEEVDMKRMRKGGKAALNIYIAELDSLKLGWGTFP
jgi:hypothetical protein